MLAHTPPDNEDVVRAKYERFLKHDTPVPLERGGVFYFKAQMGAKCNWASNFSDACDVEVDGVGLFSTIEHAFVAISKVKRGDIRLFCKGGVFDDFERFERACKERAVRIPKVPRHGLRGWIAKIMSSDARMKKFGVRTRKRALTMGRKVQLLKKLVALKFRKKNWACMWQLLDTRDKYLIELQGRFGTTPWEGVAKFDGSGRVTGVFGENIMGRLLMNRRDYLWRKMLE